MTHNSVEPEQGGLAHSATPKAQSNQVVELKLALTEAIIALADMYDQYCGDNFGHDFMGAGENAIEILEKYGLGDERKGVDQVALEKFERQHRVTDLAASNSEPTQTHTKSAPSAPQPNTEQLDKILTDLNAYSLKSIEATTKEYYAYYPELKVAKQKLLAWNKANVIEARIDELAYFEPYTTMWARTKPLPDEKPTMIMVRDRIAELNKEGETNGNHQEV